MRSKTFKEILDETPKEVEGIVRQYAKAMMEEPKELTEEEIKIVSKEYLEKERYVFREACSYAKRETERYYKHQLEKLSHELELAKEVINDKTQLEIDLHQRIADLKEHYLKMIEEALSKGQEIIMDNYDPAHGYDIVHIDKEKEEYMKQLKERIK